MEEVGGLTGGQMLPPRGSPLAYTRCTTVRGSDGMVMSGKRFMSTGYSQVVGAIVAWEHHAPGGQGTSSAGVGQ